MPDINRWICKKCSGAIDFGQGAVFFWDRNPGDDPELDQIEQFTKSGTAVRAFLVDPFHDKCLTEMERESSSYDIAVEEAQTPEQWLRWLWHLGEKDWIQQGNGLRSLLSFWWVGHGQARPSL